MPVIFGWSALFCAALFFALTLQVIRGRRSASVSLGDGGDPMLTRRIRGQANAAEQMPMTLLPLLAAEMLGGSSILLAVFAAMFCVGRLGHGIAFGWMSYSTMRMYGFALSGLGTLGILGCLFIVLIT